jgi:hypothetical protein
MMEYLKYLPLLGLLAKHPTIVGMAQQILTEVQPHIPEINQFAAELETELQQINGVSR